MIAEKKMSLKPIFESHEGIHLTTYLVNRGQIENLKMQLRESLNEAYEYLFNVMPTDERTRFLLMEFRVAEEMNVAEKNIFHIAKAAVQGRVKKLIAADGMEVFGRINRDTGAVVAPRDEIPKHRPALAILDVSDPELQMIGRLDERDMPQKEAL